MQPELEESKTTMLLTGEQYRDSIRDGRQLWINGERVYGRVALEPGLPA